MAVWGGYPQTVNYSTVNIAKGGGSENLLINPRGKVNQLNEAQGVVAAGQYFCDGWKAGAAGAEVYVDVDGFRLISGSIVQLVPNNIEQGRTLRSNMDIISGAPVMSINGGTSNEPNASGDYIHFEISGDNSKFTRIILAESAEMPIYQQVKDELIPCLRFCEVGGAAVIMNTTTSNDDTYLFVQFQETKVSAPAVTRTSDALTSKTANSSVVLITKNGFYFSKTPATANSNRVGGNFIADARP